MQRRPFYYISFGIFLMLMLGVSLGLLLLPKGKAIYYLMLSQSMLNEGDTESAIKQARNAVELQPESVVTLRGLARAYLKAGMDEEAEATIEKVIDISPDLAAAAYHDIGAIRISRGDIVGAREAIQKSVSISPELPGNYPLLGVIAIEEKDMATAEEYLAKSLELDPEDAETHFLQGYLSFKKEDYRKAIDELEKVASSRPDRPIVHALLGICYMQENLYIHALSELKTAVDLNPSDKSSMYNIVCVYSLQNRPEPALKWLERAIDNGWSDVEHMATDPDLDTIRDIPRYKELVEKAAPPDFPYDGETGSTAEEMEGILE